MQEIQPFNIIAFAYTLRSLITRTQPLLKGSGANEDGEIKPQLPRQCCKVIAQARRPSRNAICEPTTSFFQAFSLERFIFFTGSA